MDFMPLFVTAGILIVGIAIVGGLWILNEKDAAAQKTLDRERRIYGRQGEQPTYPSD